MNLATTAQNAEKREGSLEGGRNLGRTESEDSTLDPDLVAIMAAWPVVPPAVKAGILAMVNAVSTSTKPSAHRE